VVAEEVRNLAQRSAEAAKNTAALIEESQKNADSGMGISNQVSDILKQIVDGAQKVANKTSEILKISDVFDICPLFPLTLTPLNLRIKI